jgi:hypothetical protein
MRCSVCWFLLLASPNAPRCIPVVPPPDVVVVVVVGSDDSESTLGDLISGLILRRMNTPCTDTTCPPKKMAEAVGVAEGVPRKY